MLSKEERVLRVTEGKDVDYLPSQITFSDRTGDTQLSQALGLSGSEDLDAYLENYLPFGTPEQVKEKARQTIRTLGKGGGLIIAPSQEVMNDVPIANVKALVETIMAERQTVLEL